MILILTEILVIIKHLSLNILNKIEAEKQKLLVAA